MCREESAADKENDGSWVGKGEGRWETNEDWNGYNWVSELTWVPKSISVQCYCSGNNSLCELCNGIGTVRCA